MFDEYSFVTPMQLAPYAGFTEEEVRDTCAKYGRDFDMVKEWYDGYDVTDILPPDPNNKIQNASGRKISHRHYSIYSPLSVVKAVTTRVIQNYWNKTETYEALAEYIRMNLDGLKDAVALLMDGGRVVVDISTYQNDMTSFHGRDDVLTMLMHLGYLRNPFLIIMGPAHSVDFSSLTDSKCWQKKMPTHQIVEVLPYFRYFFLFFEVFL